MDRATALNTLGLDESATREEIDAARQAEMKVVHPDGSAPDEERAKRVNEAHRVAIEGLPGAEVVATNALGEIVRRNSAALEKQALAEEARGTVSRVVTHHTGELAAARRQRYAFAATTGLIGAVAALTRTVPNLAPNDYVSGILTAMGGILIVLGALFGVVAFLSKSREDGLQLTIEEAAETLGDRGTSLATLDEVGGVGSTWSRDELIDAVRRWIGRDNPDEPNNGEPLARIAEQIGPVDFARLLLAKGRENGVIEDAQIARGGGVSYGYRVVRGGR